MSRKRHIKLRALIDELVRLHPELHDPRERIRAGEVLVDGTSRRNPTSLVRVGASIVLRPRGRLRGEAKLEAALSVFPVDLRDRVALDVGAAAGGFTRVLVTAGARRVYAVDAGHGQLLGSLRQDPRVVVLETTNLGDLDRKLVPETVDVVTIDVSYLSLREAVPQFERVSIASNAAAIALVKPHFELGLSRLPTGPAELGRAVSSARRAFEVTGWRVTGVIESPVRGARGAVEFLLYACRR